MRLTSQVFETDQNQQQQEVGEIWTDGNSVMLDPVNNPTLKMMVKGFVYDYGSSNPYDTEITASSDPVKFVRNLCFKYKSHLLWATPAKEQ